MFRTALGGPRAQASRRLLHATNRLKQEVKQVEVTIDGKKVQVPATSTVLQACEAAGIEVPRFCYHERYVLQKVRRDDGLLGITIIAPTSSEISLICMIYTSMDVFLRVFLSSYATL